MYRIENKCPFLTADEGGIHMFENSECGGYFWCHARKYEFSW